MNLVTLQILWSNSLSSGVISEDVKLAKSTPIFKVRDQFLGKNYRSVALTSQLSKIIKEFLVEKVYSHMERGDI